MLLKDSNNVPLCMTSQESVVTKFSQYDEPQLKDKTKAELLGDIKSDCVDISIVKGNRVGEMHYIFHKNPISVTNRIMKEGVKVYMSNSKGRLQVLWERVFMDTSKDVCNYYTICGREDNYRKTIIETILRELMWN